MRTGRRENVLPFASAELRTLDDAYVFQKRYSTVDRHKVHFPPGPAMKLPDRHGLAIPGEQFQETFPRTGHAHSRAPEHVSYFLHT